LALIGAGHVGEGQPGDCSADLVDDTFQSRSYVESRVKDPARAGTGFLQPSGQTQR
jgi:hypothetical protein